MTSWSDVQRYLGVPADGKPGPVTLAAIARALGLADIVVEGVRPFDRAEFLARHINRQAEKIGPAHIEEAARRLNVPPSHIRAVQAVESRGRSFDSTGRPIILFEPHIFDRRTSGKFSPSTFSYARWRERPYPATIDGRWQQMADAAERDEDAALESASWGLFQIMGFHWRALKYASAQAFAACMVRGEPEHLEALVRFIEANGLAAALRRCKAGNPDSCRDFARGYNGSGYEANDYHRKLAAAIR